MYHACFPIVTESKDCSKKEGKFSSSQTWPEFIAPLFFLSVVVFSSVWEMEKKENQTYVNWGFRRHI